MLKLAKQGGIPVHEGYLKRSQLAEVDEAFLAGTTFEVVPVVRVDDLKIGSGVAGQITRKLQKLYADDVQAFLAAR